MLGGREWETGSGHLTGMEFLWGKWIRAFVLCPCEYTTPIGCTFWRVKFMAFELYLNKKIPYSVPHIGLNLVLCAIPCMEATRDPNQFALGSSVFWYRTKKEESTSNTLYIPSSLVRRVIISFLDPVPLLRHPYQRVWLWASLAYRDGHCLDVLFLIQELPAERGLCDDWARGLSTFMTGVKTLNNRFHAALACYPSMASSVRT